jgi:AAA+ ATPase superfamily predicted ATPase
MFFNRNAELSLLEKLYTEGKPKLILLMESAESGKLSF